MRTEDTRVEDELPVAANDTEEPAPGADVDPHHLRLLEAVLFAAAEPISEKRLQHRLPEGAEVKALLRRLQADYEGRGVNLVRAGTSWAFRTAPDLAQQLTQEVEVARRLSRAAVETLAIIAYHQPVTRAEIEDIRGVTVSKGSIDTLLEAGWIKPGKRRDSPGRPLTWRTTDDFLDHFGLEDLKSLPGLKDLKAAGLLETGPALNVYRAQADNEAGVPEGDDGALPANPVNTEGDEEPAAPLEPGDA